MTWLAYSHLGVAKTVQLTTQPAVALAGIPFGVQPVGRLVDGSGVLSRATGVTVTASKASGTGTLSGTLSVQTVEGVFTFTDLKMDTVTSAVTLSFASSGLTSATSSAFNVTQPNTIIGAESGSYAVTGTAAALSRTRVCACTPGSYAITGTVTNLNYSGVATSLAVTTHPAGAVSGVAFTTQPVVQLRNGSGSAVAESGVTVTAYLSSGSGTLGGTKQVVTDANGIATFTNLSITGTGSHTISFHALLSNVQTIFSDDVESDRSASYFEVDTASGVFGRASVDGSQRWRSQLAANAAHNYGSLKLGFGTVPTTGSGFTSSFNPQGPTGVDFGSVAVEFDMYHSANNLINSQDKCLRLSVFTSKDGTQAAVAHLWSNGTTALQLDPVRGVSGTTLLTSGWNDTGHFVWLGNVAGSTTLLGATATVSRRVKLVWTLNSPGQSDGALLLYYDGVLEAQSTGKSYVDTYTTFAINAAFWESYYNNTVTTAHNRMFDNLSVVGQARALTSAAALTIGLGSGEPQPGDAGITILKDFRAGGAQDLQAVTTHAQMIALFEDSLYGSSGTNPALETNLDGAGKKAVRTTWLGNDTEQNAYVESRFSGGSNILYVWAKFWLGKTATGGGVGSTGVYSLKSSWPNAHNKKILIMRASNTYRCYWKIYPPGTPIRDTEFDIDGNNFVSNGCSLNPFNSTGQEISMTMKFTLPSRIECWQNGVKVLDQSNCDLNTSAFAGVQFNATMLVPNQDMTEYMYDMVIGKE